MGRQHSVTYLCDQCGVSTDERTVGSFVPKGWLCLLFEDDEYGLLFCSAFCLMGAAAKVDREEITWEKLSDNTTG